MLGKQYCKYRETIKIVCRSTLRAHEIIYKNLFSKTRSSLSKAVTTNMKSPPFGLWRVSSSTGQKPSRKMPTCLLSFILETYIVKTSITLIYKTKLLALFFHQELACQSQIPASVLPSFQHQLPT